MLAGLYSLIRASLPCSGPLFQSQEGVVSPVVRPRPPALNKEGQARLYSIQGLGRGAVPCFFDDSHIEHNVGPCLIQLLPCMSHYRQPCVPLVAKIIPPQLSPIPDCSFSNSLLGSPLHPQFSFPPEHGPHLCLFYTRFLDGFNFVFSSCPNHH